nr:reverse transcriptase domain-containing protein [Tanacetum cinerariifolium]
MLNPTLDVGMESIFRSTSQMDVQTPTFVAPLPITAPTMTSSTIATTTTTSQAPTLPTIVPSTIIQNLPNFGSLFRFDDRLRSLEENFSEFRQTNQFAGAVSSIPGIVNHYMDQRMNEAVKVAIQIQSDRLHDYSPKVQSQRRVNPKIHDVIKKEVEKILDAGLIYLISDSPWVSPVHCVPKKGGMTVFTNDEKELVPTRLVTGWRVCIDYRKLNEATPKDHFPLPFIDQMLERLTGNEYYCFLHGFLGYF